MDFLIIAKWLTNYDSMVGATPPSIITCMITMFLNFGKADPSDAETLVIENQTLVMRICLILGFITVPFMLYVKPIYLNNKHKRKE